MIFLIRNDIPNPNGVQMTFLLNVITIPLLSIQVFEQKISQRYYI